MESSLLAPGLGPMGLRGMKFAGLCEAPPPTVGATTRCVTFYLQRCEAYSLLNTSSNGPNAGVLTALRHGLREVRVQGGFTCHDMLPLADLLLVGSPVIQTGGGVLPTAAAAAAAAAAATRSGASSTPSPTSSPIEDEIALYDGWCAQAGTTRAEVASVVARIQRLDFSKSMLRIKGVFKPRAGLRSHGAVSLAKVLERSDTIEEVRLNRNKIGAYGAAAIARALASRIIRRQATGGGRGGGGGGGLKVLRMRHCSIGEAGARAFAEHLICPGINLAKEFESRTLLDYPDPLGCGNGGDGRSCVCCSPFGSYSYYSPATRATPSSPFSIGRSSSGGSPSRSRSGSRSRSRTASGGSTGGGDENEGKAEGGVNVGTDFGEGEVHHDDSSGSISSGKIGVEEEGDIGDETEGGDEDENDGAGDEDDDDDRPAALAVSLAHPRDPLRGPLAGSAAPLFNTVASLSEAATTASTSWLPRFFSSGSSGSSGGGGGGGERKEKQVSPITSGEEAKATTPAAAVTTADATSTPTPSSSSSGLRKRRNAGKGDGSGISSSVGSGVASDGSGGVGGVASGALTSPTAGSSTGGGGGASWQERQVQRQLQQQQLQQQQQQQQQVEQVVEASMFLDLSANAIGWQGLCILALAVDKRREQGLPSLALEVDANSVLAEVMNSVTHGVGALLCIIGSVALCGKAKMLGRHHSCVLVYSLSLCLLYIASTLYHSFFLLPTRVLDVFHFLDKAGIYILIAGTYTPFLVILFPNEPKWSVYLLSFVWGVSLIGITASALLPKSVFKARLSLTLYLCLGWTAVLIMGDMKRKLSDAALNFLLYGGVMYTAGVPLFVRNRNLDHAIWHLFVLAGSAFHWICIYFYLVEMP